MSKIDVNDAIEEYQNKRFRSGKQELDFLEIYNIPVLPITEKLIYSYDYGDGWEVLISCENAYKQDEEGAWKDMNAETPDVSVDNLEEIIARHRPICIDKDGMDRKKN